MVSCDFSSGCCRFLCCSVVTLFAKIRGILNAGMAEILCLKK